MSARKLIHNTVTAAAIVAVLSGYSAHAIPPINAIEGDVMFSAVENGAFLLKRVDWEIISLKDQSTRKDTRHTFTTKLPSGDYIAKLDCKGRHFERKFTIVTPSHNVIIDCAAK